MAETYDNGSQRRLMQLILIFAGNEFHGLSPGELAKAAKVAPGTITRDLHNLKEGGFIEQIEETGRWRLGPKLVQIALAFQTNLGRAKSRLTEVEQRFSREP
jgi:DNA-binding IclR family transcriptional regulator